MYGSYDPYPLVYTKFYVIASSRTSIQLLIYNVSCLHAEFNVGLLLPRDFPTKGINICNSSLRIDLNSFKCY